MSLPGNNHLHLKPSSSHNESPSTGPIEPKSSEKEADPSLTDLPRKMDHNFGEWFYGNISLTQRQSRTVRRPSSIMKVFSSRRKLRLITQDLNKQKASKLGIIKTYNVAMDESSTSSADTSKERALSLILNNNTVLVDRRVDLGGRMKNVSTGNGRVDRRKSLIAIEEDCDDSE